MRRLHIISGSVILTAWVASLANGIFTGDYTGMNLTTPVMLIFAGYLFGDTLLRRREANGN